MSDILSAISILLAIVLFFYEKTTRDIHKVLEKSIPTRQQRKELERLRNEFSKTIFISFVYYFIYLIFFWLLLPTSFNLLMNSKFSIWNFDLSSTIYLIINFTILVFFINSVMNSIHLIKRWRYIIKITLE